MRFVLPVLVATLVACQNSRDPSRCEPVVTDDECETCPPVVPVIVSQDDDGDGFTVENGDCDDADSGIHPGSREQVDGENGDQNCDGELGLPVEQRSYWMEDETLCASSSVFYLGYNPDHVVITARDPIKHINYSALPPSEVRADAYCWDMSALQINTLDLCVQTTPWLRSQAPTFMGDMMTNGANVLDYCSAWDDPLCGQTWGGNWTISVLIPSSGAGPGVVVGPCAP